MLGYFFMAEISVGNIWGWEFSGGMSGRICLGGFSAIRLIFRGENVQSECLGQLFSGEICHKG